MEYGQTFWVAVSFFIFVAVVYKPVGGLIIKALDDRAMKIKSELGEALRLKEEAQALLASYQRKQKEIMETAERIVDEAEAEAKRIIESAERDLDDALNKRIGLAMQKIASHEASVIQDVKNSSIDVAIRTVRALIVESMSKSVADDVVDVALTSMNKKLH